MLRRFAPAMLLIFLAGVFFTPLVLDPEQVLYSDHSDMLAMHLPMKRFLVRSWQENDELPRWCPYSFGGMPFLLPLLYQIGMGFKPWQAGLLTMPAAASAIGMKVFSRTLLARFGHRTVLILNTVFLGLTMTVFTQVGPGTPVCTSEVSDE